MAGSTERSSRTDQRTLPPRRSRSPPSWRTMRRGAPVEAIEALPVFKRKSELKRKLMKTSNRVSWVGKAEARMKKLRAKISEAEAAGELDTAGKMQTELSALQEIKDEHEDAKVGSEPKSAPPNPRGGAAAAQVDEYRTPLGAVPRALPVHRQGEALRRWRSRALVRGLLGATRGLQGDDRWRRAKRGRARLHHATDRRRRAPRSTVAEGVGRSREKRPRSGRADACAGRALQALASARGCLV